jgi:hypothetical protein
MHLYSGPPTHFCSGVDRFLEGRLWLRYYAELWPAAGGGLMMGALDGRGPQEARRVAVVVVGWDQADIDIGKGLRPRPHLED